MMLLFSFALLVADGPAFAATLLPEAGAPRNGKSGVIVRLNDRDLALRTIEGKEETISRERLLCLVQEPASEPATSAPIRVVTTDGTRLLAKAFATDERMATITLTDGRSVETPIDRVLAVLFRPTAAPLAARWLETALAPRKTDKLMIAKEEKSLELDGILGPIDAKGARFNLDGEEVTAPTDRLVAAYYAHPFVPPEAQADLIDQSGNFWVADRLTITEGTVRFQSIGDRAMELPLTAIKRVNFARGRIMFLSDVEPAAYRQIPFFDVVWDYSRDQAPQGSRLRVAGVEFDKGLAVHARTVIDYTLGGKFRRFEATVGIDDSAGGFGDAQVRVFADQRSIWEGRVRAGQPAIPVSVAVEGAARLTLEVDYGEGLDVGDVVVFGDARVIK